MPRTGGAAPSPFIALVAAAPHPTRGCFLDQSRPTTIGDRWPERTGPRPRRPPIAGAPNRGLPVRPGCPHRQPARSRAADDRPCCEPRSHRFRSGHTRGLRRTEHPVPAFHLELSQHCPSSTMAWRNSSQSGCSPVPHGTSPPMSRRSRRSAPRPPATTPPFPRARHRRSSHPWSREAMPAGHGAGSSSGPGVGDRNANDVVLAGNVEDVRDLRTPVSPESDERSPIVLTYEGERGGKVDGHGPTVMILAMAVTAAARSVR